MKTSPFSLENKALDFFSRHPIKSGTPVVVAVSGGADSAALLTCLHRLSGELSIKLLCAHVNHNLRGAESDGDESFVRSLCESYGVPIRVLSADVTGYSSAHGLGTEEAGREIRYAFFEECAEALGEGALIATAHTLSDSAETFFFNSARGTGLSGLRGIPEIRGRIIRPLIECTGSETADYCHALGVNYVTDSSNLTNDYDRNKIRHGVIPVLREINPSFEKSLLSLMKTVSEAKELIDGETDRLLLSAKTDKGYSVSVLREAPDCLKAESAVRILTEFGFTANSERARELSAAFSKESYCRELSENRYIVIEKGEVFSKEKTSPTEKLPKTPFSEGETAFPNGKALIASVFTADSLKNHNKFRDYSSKELLDYDKIQGAAVFRSRKEGDAADIHGGTKSLKKLFNEHHIPPESRDGVIVLADEAGVIWIEGIGTARRCRVSEKTKKFVGIKIRRQSRLIN